MSKRICAIYRSSQHEGMYLYVDKAEALSRVPEPLLKQFGRAEQAMVLLIESGRKLARADADKVLSAIAEQGFYLQMPPQPEVLNPREGRPE